MNTGQLPLLLSSSRSKSVFWTSLKADPKALNLTLPFCDRLTPDLFYYHVPLKNKNDTQETPLM